MDSRRRTTDRIFNIQDIIKLLMFFIGGGATGYGLISTAPTNTALSTKLDSAIEHIQRHEIAIINNKADIERRTQRVENYIVAHDKQEISSKEFNDSQFKHIRELLQEIKSDIRYLKNNR